MKKYKLIKEYPGSVKVGTIVEWSHLFKCFVNSSDKTIKLKPLPVDYNEVEWSVSLFETYKEFWEEVVEKDYEILSIFYNNNLFDIIKYSDFNSQKQYWSKVTGTWIHETIHGRKINSIKRLSDEEVFTVGDKIIGTMSIDENLKFGPGYTFIKSFRFINNMLYADISTGVLNIDKSFSNIKKYIEKQPLFKTEDGVDIFEGDTIYVPQTASKWEISSYRVYSISKYTKAKVFSTKEKAEEWVIMNKPCLSLREVLDLYNSDGYISSIYKDNELIKKVKQKLNM